MIYEVGTWKIGKDRYIHEVRISFGFLYLVTSSYFPDNLDALILSNTFTKKRDLTKINGLKKVVTRDRMRCFSFQEEAMMFFSGSDNWEQRRKIFGEERDELITICIDELSSGMNVKWSGKTIYFPNCHTFRNPNKKMTNFRIRKESWFRIRYCGSLKRKIRVKLSNLVLNLYGSGVERT